MHTWCTHTYMYIAHKHTNRTKRATEYIYMYMYIFILQTRSLSKVIQLVSSLRNLLNVGNHHSLHLQSITVWCIIHNNYIMQRLCLVHVYTYTYVM